MGGVLYIFWDGFGGTVSTRLSGQWSSVLALQSDQPIIQLYGQETVTITSEQPLITLYGQEWVSVGSDQSRYEVNLD